MIGYRYKAKCVKVVDGDTIDCQVDLGFNHWLMGRFRLNRINAPETNSPDVAIRTKAMESKSFVTSSIDMKEIEIVSYKAEKYGRYLAEVFYKHPSHADLVNLNDELLQLGLAEKYV